MYIIILQYNLWPFKCKTLRRTVPGAGEVVHKNGLLAVSVVRHLSPEISGGGAVAAAASVGPSDIITVAPPRPPARTVAPSPRSRSITSFCYLPHGKPF